jgi:hypothetical protein
MSTGTGWMNYSSSDPRKLSSQATRYVGDTGQGLQDQAGAEATIQGQRSDATTDQLANWMSPMAAGQGGYNADELSQIQMTPQQQRDMTTAAGITAGNTTANAVQGAQRQAASAGMSPEALATYRMRAARGGSSDAADAMTKARVATSDAASTREQAIGNARMGQQSSALNWYQNLQQQQNQNKQSDLDRQSSLYGTTSNGILSGTDAQMKASQTPTTFDKVAGAITSFLADGDVMPGSTPAVVGENGPEKVVQMPPKRMDDGGWSVLPQQQPTAGTSIFQSPTAPAPPAAPGSPAAAQQAPQSFMDKLKTMFKQSPAATAQQPGGSGGNSFNPVSTYQNLGGAARGAVSAFAPKLLAMLEDGGTTAPQGANGIFTKPTRVNLSPGEAVVPLSFRAKAKVRPSMASLPAATVGGR